MSRNVSIIVGPARCGKTHELLRQYRAALRASAGSVGPGRVLWLAPTSRAATAIRGRLLTSELDACMDPGIVTFDGLANRILLEVPDPPRLVTLLQQRYLVRRVVEAAAAKNSLAALAEAARRTSLIDLLVEHFRELKRRGIRPTELAKSPPPRGMGRDLHEELTRLYVDYERQLAESKLCDREGRQLAVADALARNKRVLDRLDLVVADGFTDFTAAQQTILGELGKRAPRVLISLPADSKSTLGSSDEERDGHCGERKDLFAKPAATLAELRRHHPRLEVVALPPRLTDWPALDHIARNVFRHPREIPDPPPEVTGSLSQLEIVTAAGVHNEIVQLARLIKRRLLAGQDRPGDLVIVFRHLREAAPRVREVFDQFGIPYALEAGRPLVGCGVIRTVLALLRLDSDDWPFRRVVDVVTNNLLIVPDRKARVAAEWLVRDLQIAQGREALLERVDTLCEEAGEKLSRVAHNNPTDDDAADVTHHERRLAAAVAARPMLRQLAAALTELPTAATPREWMSALVNLARRLGLEGLAASEPIEGSEDEPLKRENRVAWQCMAENIASLERLAAWQGEPPPQIPRGEILSLLVDIASHESLPRPPDAFGRVRVLSAATARTIEAKHLILAGMSEQSFPSLERVGQLYSEADYQVLSNALDQRRAESGTAAIRRSHDEMLLFYEVLTRATERLTISYSALDDKAQALPPSPYVTELERTFKKGQVQLAPAEAPRPSPLPTGPAPLSRADWRIQAVHQALAGDDALFARLLSAPAMAATAHSLGAALRVTAARSHRDAFGPAEGLLQSDAVRQRLAKRFGPQHLWSPSQWEDYARCPFHFYLNEVLDVEPLGELTLESDPRRRGILWHNVLAAFHRQLRETFGSRGTPSKQELGKFVDHFNSVLEAAVAAEPRSGVDAALLEIDRRQLAKLGGQYYEQHSKYDGAWSKFDKPPIPTHFELRFGPPRYEERGGEDARSTSLPFELEIGKELIRITGRIDRIDVGRSGERTVFNVIDYKSGRRPTLTAEKMESGERLQPALYVMAAQAMLFGDEGTTPLWAGYWSMDKGVTTDKRYSLVCSVDGQKTSDEWRELEKKIKDRVAQFVADIRRGDFPVSSRDEHCTSYCEFSTVCRVGQVRSLEKQWLADEE